MRTIAVFVLQVAISHYSKGQDRDKNVIQESIESLKIKDMLEEKINDSDQEVQEIRREIEAANRGKWLCVLDDKKPSFFLYARWYEYAAITDQSIPDFYDGSKWTIFVVHGWRGSTKSGWQNGYAQKFLKNYDVNVIVVDWSDMDCIFYPTAAARMQLVGKYIADIARVMVKEKGLVQDNLYCIGSSLGAQACGFAGKNLKFGRITGLDPAGPGFWLKPPSKRLDKTDANFVDNIHTSRVFGMHKNIGHVDFYPNGGERQPGCDESEMWEVLCSHTRPIRLFSVSIDNPCFNVLMNCTDINNLPGSCVKYDFPIQNMGLSAQIFKQEGIYYLETSAHSPFCTL